jgi:DNA repair protein RadC
VAGSVDRGNQPSEIEARIRQHALLAKLVDSIAPDGAEAVASELLKAFGTIGGVFGASHSALAKAGGNQALASLLLRARFAVLEGLREDVRGAPFDLQDSRFLTYLVAKMQGAVEEELHALFLDRRRSYVADEIVASGSWDQISLRLRPLMRRAIELNAASIVLFHNHPSGAAEASEIDCQFTAGVRSAADALGIELFDHLIVAGPHVLSMRSAGLI